MKKQYTFLIVVAILALLVVGITQCQTKNKNPSWINDMISKPKNERPMQIYSCSGYGNPTYLVLAPCCDNFNTLYDQAGNKICSPSGGLTGRGDGRCADFNISMCKSIWKN